MISTVDSSGAIHQKTRGRAAGRRQQVVGFLVLALVLPQARQAHGSAQFEGLRLLLTRHVEGLLKTRLGVVLLATSRAQVALGGAPEPQFAPLALHAKVAGAALEPHLARKCLVRRLDLGLGLLALPE